MKRRAKLTLFIRLGIFIFVSASLAACSGNRSIERPNGVAQAADGSVFIMDFGQNRIVHARSDGAFLGVIGRFGTTADQIFHGFDMALDAEGNVYICNLVSNDERVLHDGVKVFTSSGRFVREIGSSDYDPDSYEPANKPYGLELDQQGRIYTADYGTSTIRVFTPQGQLISAFSITDAEGNSYKGLNDVAVDERRGLLYTTDFDFSVVRQYQLSFDENGNPSSIKLAKTIATYGTQKAEVAFPQYLAVNDETGWVYVGDLANRRIQIFDAEGNHLGHFAPPSVKDWQNMGIQIGLGGQVLVADAYNSVIWVFQADGSFDHRIEVH